MKFRVLEHFRSVLGNNELVLSKNGVDVYKWDDPFETGNVVLTTVGMMGKNKVEIGGGNIPVRGTELLMFCRPHDVKLVAQLLVDVSAYQGSAEVNIRWWHVLPLGRAIVPDSKLCHLLFMVPPFDADFSVFRCQDKRVDILWAVPIADSERSIFEFNGADVLEQQLEERDVVFVDLFRDPIAK